MGWALHRPIINPGITHSDTFISNIHPKDLQNHPG